MSKQQARYFCCYFVPGVVYRLCNKLLMIYGSDGSSGPGPKEASDGDWLAANYIEITEEQAIERLDGLRPWFDVKKKRVDDRAKLDQCLSALRVILTWAEFEHDGHPRGHALVPDHVSALIRKTLKEILEKQ